MARQGRIAALESELAEHRELYTVADRERSLFRDQFLAKDAELATAQATIAERDAEIAWLREANAEHLKDGEFGRLVTKYLIENHAAEYDAAHHYASKELGIE